MTHLLSIWKAFKVVNADEVLTKITTMPRDTYLPDFVETLSDLEPAS